MSRRQANSTITGFYYQFLHTVHFCISMLEGQDLNLLCEGIDDIDIIERENKTVIQVKTSSAPISIADERFKKTILNFYKEYIKNQRLLFIFHASASPGKDRIGGEQFDTIKDWMTLQENNWEDLDRSNKVLERIKSILEIYLKDRPEEKIDLSKFTIDFAKKVNLEFRKRLTEDYKTQIMTRLKKVYPRASDAYHRCVFQNILLFVITKSTGKEINDRYIDRDSLDGVLQDAQTQFESAIKQVLVENEDSSFKRELLEILFPLEYLTDLTKQSCNNTDALLNKNIIEWINPPQEKILDYDEFIFVKKLLTAKIPEELIRYAKECFYESEYAIEKIGIPHSEEKLQTLKSLSGRIKQIYRLQYTNGKAHSCDSVKLLTSTHDKITDLSNTTLSCGLGFDFFHKIGLLHQLSDEDEEIIWTIK